MHSSIKIVLLFAILFCVGCNSRPSGFNIDESCDKCEARQEFFEYILKEKSTFNMDFSEIDSLGINIVKSEDGKIKIYSIGNCRWDACGCQGYLFVCQTCIDGKVHTFDWSEEVVGMMYINAIRQVESLTGTVYLLEIINEGLHSIGYGVYSYRLGKRGKLIPIDVFERITELDSYSEEENVSSNCEENGYAYCIWSGLEMGSENPSMYMNGGWSDNFFFDITGEDIYLPIDPGYNHFFNDNYYQFHWDGEYFEYYGETYNPALVPYVEESGALVEEFTIGKSIIRIERLEDGTYRYLAWKKKLLFISEPDLVINEGWYHEVKHEYHFQNAEYEYIVNTDELQLQILYTNPKTHKTSEFAKYSYCAEPICE